MARIVKKPEDRKKEIMDMAEMLFMTEGYENTSVNTIVDKLSIAKGTFYHYFSSKEEILGAIFERYMDNFAVSLSGIYNNKDIEPREKMGIILKRLIIPNMQNENLAVNIKDDREAKLHSVIEKRFFQTFKPVIVGILKEGIEKGVFNINYPEEISEVLLMGIQGYMHIHSPNFGDSEYAFIKLKALEEIFERVLGLEQGSFPMI